MKNIKKCLLSLMLAVVLCLPIALAGCTKHYEVKVSIANGSSAYGKVVTVKSVTHNEVNLVGKHDIEQGNKFEFSVVPTDTHYQVWYIKVNGKFVYVADGHENTKLDVYNPNNAIDEGDRINGIIRPAITINKDTKIEVAFEAKTYTCNVYYKNDNEEYIKYVGSGDFEIARKYDEPLVSTSADSFNGNVEVFAKLTGSNSALTKMKNFDFSNFVITGNYDLYFDCDVTTLDLILQSWDVL